MVLSVAAPGGHSGGSICRLLESVYLKVSRWCVLPELMRHSGNIEIKDEAAFILEAIVWQIFTARDGRAQMMRLNEVAASLSGRRRVTGNTNAGAPAPLPPTSLLRSLIHSKPLQPQR